jgi:hypothetical protein
MILTRYTLLNPPIAKHLYILYFFNRPYAIYSRQLKLYLLVNIPLPIDI